MTNDLLDQIIAPEEDPWRWRWYFPGRGGWGWKMLRSWRGLSLGSDKSSFDNGRIMRDIYLLKLATGYFLVFQHMKNVGNHRLNLGDDVTTNTGRGSMRR